MRNLLTWKRSMAFCLSTGLAVGSVLPAAAAESVYGTIRAAGPAWVSDDASDWSSVGGTRPLVSGDHVRTGSDGYLLADLGPQGVVGLYGDARVSAASKGQAAVIGVDEGKVAFHVNEGSAMTISVAGASVGAEAPADGYVEVGEKGRTTVTAERGALVVAFAGESRRVEQGERLIVETREVEPAMVLADASGANGPASTGTPAAPAGGGGFFSKLTAPTVLGATALAIVAGAVVYEVTDDDGGDDDEMSKK